LLLAWGNVCVVVIVSPDGGSRDESEIDANVLMGILGWGSSSRHAGRVIAVACIGVEWLGSDLDGWLARVGEVECWGCADRRSCRGWAEDSCRFESRRGHVGGVVGVGRRRTRSVRGGGIGGERGKELGGEAGVGRRICRVGGYDGGVWGGRATRGRGRAKGGDLRGRV
jgi:hypothetical protein